MSFKDFWFQEPKDKCHENLIMNVKEIAIRQAYRTQENLANYKLYMNGTFLDPMSRDYVHSSLSRRLYVNLVQIIISTLTSKIARNRPKPTFLTDEGDYDQQEKAKNLDKFMLGQFYKSKVYEETAKEFLMAGIFGTGFVHVFREGNECKVENVHADELLTDDRESLHGKPRNLYRYKNVSKILLKSKFPKFEKQISDSGKLSEHGYYMGDAVIDDMVTVVEAWHLPDYNGENGRHVIAIENATLLDEVWKKDYFPFPKFKFQDRGIGFYGRGVSELISSIQLEANKIFERIQQNIHLTTVPRVLYEYSSKIVKAKFNNEIGGLIGYTGTPPQFITPSGVAPELFNWMSMLVEYAFREIGVSELSAASQKPAGLNSGAAIREYSDIESDRFSNLQQRWEAHHLEITDQIIDVIKEIAEDEGDYAVLSGEKYGAIRIKWKDVDMAKDAYIMQVYPTSLLPTHPAGRLATVNEMVAGGLIDRVDALDLLDYPDVKKYISFETAPKQDIMATISSILKGEYATPEPEQDLMNGVKMMQFAYLHYKHKGVKEDRLNMFRVWISDATDLINQAQQAAMEQQMQQQMAMQAQQAPQMPQAQDMQISPEAQLQDTSMMTQGLEQSSPIL